MALLRSALFQLVFYLGCLPTVAGAMLAVRFGQEATIRESRRWARWHRWCAKWLLGVEVEIEGILPQADTLIVLKHESMFEAIQTLVLFDRPAVVMKAELVAMFGWGYAAHAHGVIPVDREAGAAAMRRMIAAARAAKAAGRPVVLFPEGTRVPHGKQPPLRPGLAGLYKVLDWPVVPIALDSGRIWPRGFVKHAGIIHVKVGEPIPPGLPRTELEARVHAAINALNG